MPLSAWYMPSEVHDQRAANHLEPNEAVSEEELAKYGVLYWKLSGNADDSQLLKLKTDRGYDYTDCITCSPEKLPDYENKIKSFFEEHIHTDEEIRYIQDGSGYFDIRDKGDRWIRIKVEKGDLIILPEGIYHRFTLDEHDFIVAQRLFRGEPIWTPHNRDVSETPAMPSRAKYEADFLASLAVDAPAAAAVASA